MKKIYSTKEDLEKILNKLILNARIFIILLSSVGEGVKTLNLPSVRNENGKVSEKLLSVRKLTLNPR